MRPFAALSSGRRWAHNQPVNLPRRLPLLCALGAVPVPAACSSVSEVSQGLVIAVAAEPPTSPERDADGRLIVGTDLGFRVTLSRAYLVSTSVEIFSCKPIAARPWQRWRCPLN